ncbi:PRC-barrel domain-containing protein [Sphingomonas sp. BIUV-7]|uniref:PRC-barrel domain-containing protein n=1 Tax=Sphingomonas natans TaxID=3063330 RepID=A0ABT8YCN8_9SPHN|nr:PRC-barrel domain-containing protein [Sphingomonas sp. BIUV-7]MDO6416095.1 PRC-barrel domain-containing protein [Sphingomonas sp. BIUV-7]
MIEREVETGGPDGFIEDVESDAAIAADEVQGAALYGPDGAKVGHIHKLMIDKRSGQVRYAIVTDAGILGIGNYLPVSWSRFKFDENLHGYVSDVTAEIIAERGRDTAEHGDLQIW